MLRLVTWLSPAFPTGAYAYSHGLEWAVGAGDVTDSESLLEWLLDLLRHGAGRSDAILLRHAHRAAGDPGVLVGIAELAAAAALPRERHAEALDIGHAFTAAAVPWTTAPLPAGMTHAVAFGALAGCHGIPEDDAAAAFLHAFAANLVSAAVRLVPLGQSAGLRVLAAVEQPVLQIAAETRGASLDDIGGCAWRGEIAAMRHETQYTRLFRS